ncbi:MAG: DUF4242 domain-containing protein [Ferruginibacter sp.]
MAKQLTVFIAILFFGITTLQAQTSPANNPSATKNKTTMKTFLIERDIPGAGSLTPQQLKGISQNSCSVLTEMGPSIEWVQSYVAGNKIYCVYRAENEELIRQHAKKGGFPANVITEVANIISPATAIK